MNNTRICIIDDHSIVRQGLKDLLDKMSGFEVVLEFENGQDLLDALPLSSQADIFILDYSMPDLNGIEVLKLLEKREEKYKVLLLTQHFNEDIINEAYHFGARGFLNKNCSAQEIKSSIDNIVKLGYNNVQEILKRMKGYQPEEQEEINPELTSRELEFLTLVCSEKEYSYEQMAVVMNVSIKTLEVCRKNLCLRYNIKSKVGLVLFSFNHKLTEPFI
jgi:DNA-binding NarL/FixJ family response regulator